MTRNELLEVSREPNVRAWLDVIAACEGTAGPNGYRTRFGGGLFESLADHPGGTVSVTMKGRPITSSAAGRYQFLAATWRSLVSQCGFPSFEPQWQDAGAVALIEGRGALDEVRAGRIERAVVLLNREWASLPGSPYGQPIKTMAFVIDTYLRAGGRLDAGAPIENLTAPPPPPPPAPPAAAAPAQPPAPVAAPKERRVSPFILPALDALVSLVPTIANLFKGETPSKVYERNADAVSAIADKVLPIVVAAAGAPNVQAAVEAAQVDPKVAAEIEAAARREYHALAEVSLDKARDFAVAYAAAPIGRTVLGRFTFLELLTLVLIANSAGLILVLIWRGMLTGELLGAIVMLVVVAGFVDVRKFWLGLPAAEPPREGPHAGP